jgi:hypothetical protein
VALKELTSKDLIEDNEGARVILIEGHEILLIVVKSDGGYNYASTDLAALWLVIFTIIILVLIYFVKLINSLVVYPYFLYYSSHII